MTKAEHSWGQIPADGASATARASVLSSKTARPIRVLDLMEAHSITGPAKNLFEFAHLVSKTQARSSPIDIRMATYQRGTAVTATPFVLSALDIGIDVEQIRERFAWDPGILSQLRALVEERRPDIIQTHNFKSHFLVRLTRLYLRSRWIAFHHGYTWTDLKNRAYNQLDRWSLPAAHHVVTVCRSFASDLERIGVPTGHITVQHNMVQPFVPPPQAERSETRKALGIPEGALVVLSVGRLSHEKGHLDLIEAIGRLQRDFNRHAFRVVIVGDGPELSAIRRRAGMLGVTDKLIFTGYQRDPAVHYSIADLMVLPSHSEGSPNVLLEAMAAGLPSVATAIGGVPEIAKHERTALLVEKGNHVALADAIRTLLCDEELRKKLGANAKREALRYAPENYCNSMLELYQNILAEGEKNANVSKATSNGSH